jgi:dedicator of cytokinesis protein 3
MLCIPSTGKCVLRHNAHDQLAYIDLIPLDSLFGKSGSLLAPASLLGTTPVSPHNSNRLSLISSMGHRRNLSLAPDIPTGSHYHAYLDVRAFVASPCAPGETAELYFSLYNNQESRFITEEFCLVLNHLGSPARNPEQRLGRLRTLFTDLKHDDLAPTGSIYLVCRIVRNGSLKMRSEANAGTLESHYRSTNHRRASGNLLGDMGTMRSVASFSESATDDSFSVTSGFGGHRVNTIETSLTGEASLVDGRPSFRRPLGCAVLELPILTKLMGDGEGSGGPEFIMPIYVPRDEATFANLHEDIIHNRSRDCLKSSK